MSIRSRIANFLDPTQKNAVAMGQDLAQEFLRYGPKQITYPDWSQLVMNETDKYTGYMYGAIGRRSNKVAWLARYNLLTDANAATSEATKKSKETLEHPYLKIIDESPTFANDAFWRHIQTFVDIKGEYFLMAIRGQTTKATGDITEFKLLNPYNITTVYDQDELNIIGYVETYHAMTRQIPPHMIIRIRQLNPFDDQKPYSLADAARDAQFTLKETSEQMRTGARRNRKYPGVILMGNGEVALDSEQVANFKSRMRGKAADDEPMFASGSASTLQWNDMQIDMRKSAVDVVNEIQLNALIAVTGVSKTKFGIEQSGVTRDTAAIQDDLFVTDHGMPALQLIIDALNQDYKTNYPDEYAANGYTLYIDSPLKEDKDAELTDVANRTNTFDLFQTLVDEGYDIDTAAQYAAGDKELVDIGEPTNEAKPSPVVTPPVDPVVQDPVIDPPISTKSSYDHSHEELPVITNRLNEKDQSTIAQQEGALKNAVVNVQNHVIALVLNKVTKNDFKSANDIIDESDRKTQTGQLELSIATFYGIIIPLAAQSTMNRRISEFKKMGSFSLDQEINQYIKLTASRVASGHMDTILGDILNTIRTTEENIVQGELTKIVPTGEQSTPEQLAKARELALQGPGRQQLASAIKQAYNDTISKARATTVARTETSRAFNRAQFDADREFLAQNDLTGRAYKQWVTTSSNPCPICLGLAAEPPIPFEQDFAQVGDVLKGTFEKADGSAGLLQQVVGFEDIDCGNAHPNCSCKYQLIVE